MLKIHTKQITIFYDVFLNFKNIDIPEMEHLQTIGIDHIPLEEKNQIKGFEYVLEKLSTKAPNLKMVELTTNEYYKLVYKILFESLTNFLESKLITIDKYAKIIKSKKLKVQLNNPWIKIMAVNRLQERILPMFVFPKPFFKTNHFKLTISTKIVYRSIRFTICKSVSC